MEQQAALGAVLGVAPRWLEGRAGGEGAGVPPGYVSLGGPVGGGSEIRNNQGRRAGSMWGG
ncbi:hypothetical protein SSCG_05729 [Streptomyces clavuligerus]|nr:hypothetical protein SSCG_05729 [Streptomyces clavuligerus]